MTNDLEHALESANLIVTFNNQKRVLKEKFRLECTFYQNGGSFTVTRELITFVKALVDTGNTDDIVLLDDNELPIEISDLTVFLNKIIDVYFTAANSYFAEYQKIKSTRSIKKVIDL